jgi:ubiquinone/menaquinone biosynthesis C-methylase UbiE
MTRQEILDTYDQSYAYRYNNTFLLNPEHSFHKKTLFELALLKRLTEKADSWLDIACGTGYFLKHGRGNPHIECAGLDLSPAMLAEARIANPDVYFIEADFLLAQPTFENRWDVITCMWGAYGLLENVSEIETLIGNMVKWTKPNGICFVPIFDLVEFAGRRDRGTLMEGVEIDLENFRWSFIEPDGKRHRNMLAPPVLSMTALFENFFGAIETLPYPDVPGMLGIISQKIK